MDRADPRRVPRDQQPVQRHLGLTRLADTDHWSAEAENWIAWARRDGHDAFWSYRGALAEFVGAGSGAAVEIGCGEGRVCRLLRDLGYRVTAVEPVDALREAARTAGSADAYIAARASDLPLEGGRFELVVLYNVLMDVDDLDASVAEAGRILAPAGRIVVGIVHPLADLLPDLLVGDPAAAAYFDERAFLETEERNGLAMTFGGWARPLSAYVEALAGVGLAVTSMAEPRPDAGGAIGERWRHLPLFVWIEARRIG